MIWRRSGRDEGAVSIIVAVTLVSIVLPMLALTLDGGRLLVARNAMQNAADQAATAAAWASCNGRDAVSAGTTSARANLTAYEGTHVGTVPNVVVSTTAGGSWRVTIGADVDGVFSPIIGVDTISVSARAAASCTSNATPAPVIYAHATCSNAIVWSGNSNTSTGVLHTNGQLSVTGNWNSHTGPATYSGSVSSAGFQNTWQPTAPTLVPVRTWPYTFDINAFDTGGQYTSRPDYVAAPGSTTITAAWLRAQGHLSGTTLNSKIYYTDGAIDIAESMTGTATFVARGPITFRGNYINIHGHFLGLAAFGNYGGGVCGQQAIGMSGNYIKLNGIVYAPDGKVLLTGNYNEIDVAAVANQIQLTGNYMAIRANPALTVAGTPRVGLDVW